MKFSNFNTSVDFQRNLFVPFTSLENKEKKRWDKYLKGRIKTAIPSVSTFTCCGTSSCPNIIIGFLSVSQWPGIGRLLPLFAEGKAKTHVLFRPYTPQRPKIGSLRMEIRGKSALFAFQAPNE